MRIHRTASLPSVLIPGEDNSPNPVIPFHKRYCSAAQFDATCGIAIGVDRLAGVRRAQLSCGGHSRRIRPPGHFYPAVAVFWPALISFCTQISAAPATGSVLPGIVAQRFFTSIWLPS